METSPTRGAADPGARCDRPAGPAGTSARDATAAPGRRRVAGLDIARGAAVLGTLGTNIWLFTHPAGLLGSLLDPLAGIPAGAQTLAFQVLSSLSNGKFLSLLMMMFGIGVFLQFTAWRKRSRRRGWLRTYVPRAGLLFLDGLINFILIAEFDVLMGYAVTGFIIAGIIATSPRSARIWAWVTGALHVFGIGLLSLLLLTQPGSANGVAGSELTGPAADWPLWDGINPYREASFTELAVFRLDNSLIFRAEPIFTLAMGICLFIIGARLFAAGIFTEDGAGLRRRCLLIGAAAAPVDLMLGIIGSPAAVVAQRYLTASLVAVGLLALIAHASLRRWIPRAIETACAAAGRMSLSVYVGQNLLAGALFFGWGLDLAGRFPDARLALTVIGFLTVLTAVIAFALTWQTIAARRGVRGPGARGPLEWLTHIALTKLS
ncbi:DUF418 domain-containing protein [Brevibacterium sp. p3-SID960]|uniref:DUF418 domain-containing protein n=1 Tax=Brevibacterium sp. p3-SID960 TaxID=2916063 RepID=UPI0021A3E686|nr:DUF418 domain-containing protein [Brevibacterium sp. p3-SID960]MCT1691670.1 DUF418 domain-containing protein [Brevibacterium sp. p3-SID960]